MSSFFLPLPNYYFVISERVIAGVLLQCFSFWHRLVPIIN